MISGPLLRRTLRGQAGGLALVALALFLWGLLMPTIYATFGRELEVLLTSGIIPEPFLRLLGADPLSLDGAVALGAVHPVAIALQLVFPVGLGAAAIAGERQRGTLEVLLARPVARRTVVRTLLAALVAMAAATTSAQLAGVVVGALVNGVADRLDAAALAFLWLDTVLLLGALAAISLAASASSDRLGPALRVALSVALVGYVLEILGTLWPDAEVLQPVSPFHYLQPLDILGGDPEPRHLLVLAGLLAAGAAWALVRFPRRDLAAPT